MPHCLAGVVDQRSALEGLAPARRRQPDPPIDNVIAYVLDRDLGLLSPSLSRCSPPPDRTAPAVDGSGRDHFARDDAGEGQWEGRSPGAVTGPLVATSAPYRLRSVRTSGRFIRRAARPHRKMGT
jgi:hypothetical protein